MPAELRSRLAGTRFADVRWVAETGSTNADALDLARAGEPEGIVLVADHQTAGRGRLGRTWQAPPGASLLCTVLLRPEAARADNAVHAAAAAMAAAVADTTGVDPRIKWPNDLTVDDRKLAGVLAEADWRDADHVAVCVGIGVNCNWPDDVPDDLRDILVSLNQLTGAAVDREALLVSYLQGLERRLAAADPAAVLDEWRQRSATLGRDVRVDVGNDVVEGRAADLDGDGHLVVELAGGERRTITVGDVTYLRHGPPPRSA